MIKTMPDKIFSAATYCTSGGLICTGLARAYDWFHGLDWNFIALISGIIIVFQTPLDESLRESAFCRETRIATAG